MKEGGEYLGLKKNLKIKFFGRGKKRQELEHSLKLLVKTSFIVFIGVIISKILGYTYRIIIARYYGPETYGLYSIAIMIFGIIIAFSSLGLTDGLLRFIPQYRGKNEVDKISYLFRFTSKVLLITTIGSAILLFLLSSFIANYIFHNPQLTLFLRIISFFIPLAALSNITLVSIRAYELISQYSFISNILQNIARVILILLFGFLGFSSSSTVLSYCFGFVFVLASSYLICRYSIPELFLKPRLTNSKKEAVKNSFLSYSIPLLFFGIASTMFYWIDSFFLGYFNGAKSVGFYNVAVPIATLILITPELFMQLFFPLINREYYRKNYGLIAQLSKQLGKWVFMVNLPLFILIFVFPGAVINILFGSQYLVAENALRILIFGALVSSLGIISNSLLSMGGKSRLVLIDMTLACLINIILNILFIPLPKIFGINNPLGIEGAAMATIISLLFLNVLFFFQAKKNFGIMPLRIKMVKIFFIGLVTTLILLYIRSNITSQNIFIVGALATGFLATYFLIILLSNSLDRNDWNILHAIKRRIY
ncbi:MAG: flippase [Nanoarchaeota archaeon]